MRTSRLLLAVLALSLILPLLLAACGGSDELAQTSPETDREALVALYNATGGSNWERNENWLSDVPVTEWFGVATDDNGRVASLYLGENQLSGEIPPELGNLAFLTLLYLSRNRLSGEIPPELGNLAFLTLLNLSINQLSGEIPPELGNLANLTRLDLWGNQLTGEIPPELGNLANLEILVLTGNQLSGEIPPELGNLASLEGLYLRTNELSGEIPPELGNLANLTRMGLWGNQLTGEIPLELGNLANLTWLDIDDNQLSGCVPRSLLAGWNLQPWVVSSSAREAPAHPAYRRDRFLNLVDGTTKMKEATSDGQREDGRCLRQEALDADLEFLRRAAGADPGSDGGRGSRQDRGRLWRAQLGADRPFGGLDGFLAQCGLSQSNAALGVLPSCGSTTQDRGRMDGVCQRGGCYRLTEREVHRCGYCLVE